MLEEIERAEDKKKKKKAINYNVFIAIKIGSSSDLVV